ncbi:MAG: trypsin-like peptidase domain-containing protein, partial [Planctomycetota bacterium]
LDGSGRLVGVLSLNVSNARWLGVAVPIEVMLDDLRKAMRADLKERGIEPPARLLDVSSSPGEPVFPKWEERAALFRQAARRVEPSVVAIKVDRKKDDPRFKRKARRRRHPHPRAELLAELHKRPKGATASGVIVGADGWIATSYFNIAGKLGGVTVILSDGRELPARVVGWDQERDLALLNAEGKDLPAIDMRPDAALGDYVCAVGRSPSPDSLTLTTGIISAVGRGRNELLQFDAAANVGNTGGPLVGLDGRCLGIIGGISTRSRHGQNSGIAFATGARHLLTALEELKKGQKIKRRPQTWLGVVCAPGAVDLPGVLIARVRDGSPADEAGLMRNDSILKVDGVPIEGQAQLINLIRSKNDGDRITLTIRRLAREKEVAVTLGEK